MDLAYIWSTASRGRANLCPKWCTTREEGPQWHTMISKWSSWPGWWMEQDHTCSTTPTALYEESVGQSTYVYSLPVGYMERSVKPAQILNSSPKSPPSSSSAFTIRLWCKLGSPSLLLSFLMCRGSIIFLGQTAHGDSYHANQTPTPSLPKSWLTDLQMCTPQQHQHPLAITPWVPAQFLGSEQLLLVV